jgi:hypothetical protein
MLEVCKVLHVKGFKNGRDGGFLDVKKNNGGKKQTEEAQQFLCCFER